MNSQHLEYFCKIADCGSISRAAVILGINQSALSRHIRNHESDLGIPLFYRNGRGVLLTEHGQRLFERATRALEEIALAKQEALSARGGVARELVIGLTPTVGRVLVRPLAEKLIALFPEIKLRFVDGFSGHLLEWLDSGRLDLAVLYKGWAARRLNAEPLVTEKLCLVASPEMPSFKRRMPTSFLGSVDLILPSPPHGLRRLVDLIALEQKIALKITIEVDAFDSILTLVKANLGCTILPAAAIQDELLRQQLQASLLTDPEVTRTLVLVKPNNRPAVSGFAQIAATIKSELKKFETI